jgi:hypothetical protein
VWSDFHWILPSLFRDVDEQAEPAEASASMPGPSLTIEVELRGPKLDGYPVRNIYGYTAKEASASSASMPGPSGVCSDAWTQRISDAWAQRTAAAISASNASMPEPRGSAIMRGPRESAAAQASDSRASKPKPTGSVAQWLGAGPRESAAAEASASNASMLEARGSVAERITGWEQFLDGRADRSAPVHPSRRRTKRSRSLRNKIPSKLSDLAPLETGDTTIDTEAELRDQASDLVRSLEAKKDREFEEEQSRAAAVESLDLIKAEIEFRIDHEPGPADDVQARAPMPGPEEGRRLVDISDSDTEVQESQTTPGPMALFLEHAPLAALQEDPVGIAKVPA